MSRFRTAILALMVAGSVPPPASADPHDAGSTDGKSTLPGSFKDSENLGREAQRELARLGCFSGNVDDSWGREGRTAVKRLNQAAQVAWPDWPTADLVSALRTYADGYCQKCRAGDTCATGPTELEKPPRVEVQAEKPPAVVPAETPPVAAPVENQEKPPLVVPQEAKTEPQAPPEAGTGTSEGTDDQPPEAKVEEEPEKEEGRKAPANPSAPRPKRTKPPKKNVVAEPKPAVRSASPAPSPPRRPQPSPRGGSGGWPSTGPNLDGR